MTPEELLAREMRAAEQSNRWQQQSEEFLVGYVTEPTRDPGTHSAPILEMQRRLVVAVRNASASADQQAKETKTLNQRMFALTFAVGLLTFVQACTAVAEFAQRSTVNL